ncbi:MAG: hypothetical protein IKU84_06385 [Clostridia bacterium]|nr:hypothetical protein [Clostridia bacterium]
MEIFNPDTSNKQSATQTAANNAIPQHTHTVAINSKIIRCPYCQEEFDINSVLFRANLDTDTNSDNNFFTPHADDVFLNFWQNKMNWRNSAELREFSYDYSIMPKDSTVGTPVSQVKFCILDDDHIRQIVTNNGYVESAIDTRGVATDKRICPHCHSLLPLEYGVNDVHFISIVGIRGSGKTVFLSKLFEQMDDYLVGTRFYTIPTDTITRFLQTKALVPGTPVPEGTQPGRVNPPIFMDITDRAQNVRTLVFYDIAGEDCNEAANLRQVGTFVGNSAGTIMLISPGQFGSLDNISDDADVSSTNIYSVYNAIARAFGVAAARNDRDSNILRKALRLFKKDLAATDETPLAIVVSKSDMLINATIDNAPVFTGNADDIILFKNNDYPSQNSGYMESTSNQVEALVRRRLFDPLRFNTRVANVYGNTHYFAVSVLGNSPDERDMKDKDGNPIRGTDGKVVKEKLVPHNAASLRLEEPIFWILAKLGILSTI